MLYFLYQPHYVWMYDIFMLKFQAPKYFSKMLQNLQCYLYFVLSLNLARCQ